MSELTFCLFVCLFVLALVYSLSPIGIVLKVGRERARVGGGAAAQVDTSSTTTMTTMVSTKNNNMLSLGESGLPEDQDDAGDGQQERVLVVWARAALTKQGIGGL